MRILIRTSKWAIWARRIASVAVPLVVIPILLHRQRLLSSDLFASVAVVAGAVVVFSLLVACIALARLWQTGDRGWGRAIPALILSLACLGPFGYVAAQMVRYPAVTDIATTSRDLLPLAFDPEMTRMPTPRMLTQADLEKTYPNVKTRSYPLNQAQTYQIVAQLIDARGWEVERAVEPDEAFNPGFIDAGVVTLLGWREQVAVRVVGTATTAVVDMRSASVNAQHDLGSNGKRIEAFLTELDDDVTNFLRDNPNANQATDTEPDATAAPADAPAATPSKN